MNMAQPELSKIILTFSSVVAEMKQFSMSLSHLFMYPRNLLTYFVATALGLSDRIRTNRQTSSSGVSTERPVIS